MFLSHVFPGVGLTYMLLKCILKEMRIKDNKYEEVEKVDDHMIIKLVKLKSYTNLTFVIQLFFSFFLIPQQI